MFIDRPNHKKIRFTLDKYNFEDVFIELAILKEALKRSYLLLPSHKRALEDMLQDAQDRARELDLP